MNVGGAIQPDGFFGEEPELLVAAPGRPTGKQHTHPGGVEVRPQVAAIRRPGSAVELGAALRTQKHVLHHVEALTFEVQPDEIPAQCVRRGPPSGLRGVVSHVPPAIGVVRLEYQDMAITSDAEAKA